MKNKVVVIGSGFSGLSAAAFLAKSKMDVTVVEKNDQLGGRARVIKENGYVFDMGPSWYWMPDIFENFFNEFDVKTQDFYNLLELNPGFKMIFQSDELEISSDFNEVCTLFEKYESGASDKLKDFIADAQKKYLIGIDFMYKSPGVSFFEFFSKEIILNLRSFELLTTYSKHIRKYFKHPYLITLLEFPVLFLGESAKNMPALYSLMSFSALKQGTFYPEGGMNKIIQGMIKTCENLGVNFLTNCNVDNINVENSCAVSVTFNDSNIIKSDFVVASADYAHVESTMLQPQFRNYTSEYWQKKSFSPSSLIFYLGINTKLKNLIHHNLFFDEDLEVFTEEIYKQKIWPKKPLFYVCCPSKTDKSVAPRGKENIFILMPIPIGVEDNNQLREKYFNIITDKLSKYCETRIEDYIDFKKSYCINDFKSDYNSYEGNAYGLANTLMQTANLKPKITNKKVKNLFYTGQLTVPGPGVPPSLISGKLVAEYILKQNL